MILFDDDTVSSRGMPNSYIDASLEREAHIRQDGATYDVIPAHFVQHTPTSDDLYATMGIDGVYQEDNSDSENTQTTVQEEELYSDPAKANIQNEDNDTTIVEKDLYSRPDT